MSTEKIKVLQIILLSVAIASIAMSVPFAVFAGIFGVQEHAERWNCTVVEFQFYAKDSYTLEFTWKVNAVPYKETTPPYMNAIIKQTVNTHSAVYDLSYMLRLHPVSSSADCILHEPHPVIFEWKKTSFAGYISMLSIACFFGGTSVVSLVGLLVTCCHNT